MTSHYANAPVTWGIWGANTLPAGHTATEILDACQAAGYDGCELGPLGLFPQDPAALGEALAARDLRLAGAYVPIRALGTPHELDADRAALNQVCELLAAVDGRAPIILAEETYPELKALIGRPREGSPRDAGPEEWDALIEVFAAAAAAVRGWGLTASFHPHLATHVERAADLDRLMEATDLGLTLDTGHLVGGGDRWERVLDTWGPRIDHVHIKDIDETAMAQLVASGAAVSIAEISRELGQGTLDLGAFLDGLDAIGFDGWIVVEQDRSPDTARPYRDVAQEQRRNREWLRSHRQSEHSPRRKGHQ
ncbi:MAG: TIM barrel protein [Bifidobacteriaceae bacterium]|jgi:inosose dehydratase|nr:TIM barrel protein [Bifidobacteriaceae bacterium]